MGSTDWDTLNVVLMGRSCGCCEICGTIFDGFGHKDERHHRQKRGVGSSPDVVENLLLLCRACHQYAHAHPAEAQTNGWIISAHTPQTQINKIPVTRKQGRKHPVTGLETNLYNTDGTIGYA